MTPLLCHPEGFSPKGLLLLGFFPFASLRVRMTERRYSSVADATSDAVLNEAKE